MAEKSWQFESDTQHFMGPPAYAPNGYDMNPPVQQHAVIHVNNAVPAPPDYFALSLIVTIFCCLPFGIVGLVKSSEVRSRAAVGDLAGAQMSSMEAKKWSYAGLFTGLGFIVAFIVTYVVLLAFAY